MYSKVRSLLPQLVGLLSCVLLSTAIGIHSQARASDYTRVSAILRTYCSGCHNDLDSDGEFVVSTYEDLLRSETDAGRLVVPGSPESSLLYQLLTGAARPPMPPRDQPQPSSEELEWIKTWIATGAEDSLGQPEPNAPVMPQVAPAPASELRTSSAALLSNGRVALGRFGHIDIVDLSTQSLIDRFEFPGARVTAVRLSPCGKYLAIGASQMGISGEVGLLDLEKRELVLRLSGHQDAIYAVAISPDGRMLASAGYDRTIRLWDIGIQAAAGQLAGHQAAVYDLDFHPSGKMLASASADQTVKLWQVARGTLLNTLGQPEGEMRSLRFSADGSLLVAGGGDRQIRSWIIRSTEETEINPMVEARFAHETAINALVLTGDGMVFSSAIDGSVKAWTLEGLRPLGKLTSISQVPVALLGGHDDWLTVVGLTGELQTFSSAAASHVRLAEADSLKENRDRGMPANASALQAQTMEKTRDSIDGSHVDSGSIVEIPEREPNDSLGNAMQVDLPFRISGVISTGLDETNESDVDLFRFYSRSGETWIFEVEAARQQSPLDSKIEILDSEGDPVLNRRLQAVRESYFTFRGKDSSTADDFRLHKWEDMELDEFLYANSEVTRLWMYPRGPDSGFKVYPGDGPRHTFFNSTAVSHALGATAYIVRPLAAGEIPPPNGLPIFPIYFENDDDPSRRFGADSFLVFQAPAEGHYFVRVRDARAFGGPDFKYRLLGRKPVPDYQLKLSGLEMSIPVGSGREWMVSVQRHDGLLNPIEIRLDNIPPGVMATNPVTIEAGQTTAFGTIFVTEAAEVLDQAMPIKLTATVLSDSTPEILGSIRLSNYAGVQVGDVRALEEQLLLQIRTAEGPKVKLYSLDGSRRELNELVIKPGTTVSALLTVERNGFEGAISLGRDDAGRNLPHGSFVDNIGLNGLLITENRSEREIFITAAPKLEPGRRQFHFKAEIGDRPTSKPIWLVIEE